MKYIDADKLLAEIERRMTENCKLAEKAKCFGDRAVEDNDILALIESFHQEQPEGSCSEKPNNLPSNLDKAAENHMLSITTLAFDERDVILSFKTGAIWMAGQGESHETEIVSRVTGNGLLPAVTCLVNKSYKEGDKVVVQIRKK